MPTRRQLRVVDVAAARAASLAAGGPGLHEGSPGRPRRAARARPPSARARCASRCRRGRRRPAGGPARPPPSTTVERRDLQRVGAVADVERTVGVPQPPGVTGLVVDRHQRPLARGLDAQALDQSGPDVGDAHGLIRGGPDVEAAGRQRLPVPALCGDRDHGDCVATAAAVAPRSARRRTARSTSRRISPEPARINHQYGRNA